MFWKRLKTRFQRWASAGFIGMPRLLQTDETSMPNGASAGRAS